MERLSGVVMESSDRHVVLLTPQGEFKRVKITGKMPDIGEEICIRVASKRFFRMPRAGWIAAAAAVIVMLVASPLLTMVINSANAPVTPGANVSEKVAQQKPPAPVAANSGSQPQQSNNQAYKEKGLGSTETNSPSITGKSGIEAPSVAAVAEKANHALVTSNQIAEVTNNRNNNGGNSNDSVNNDNPTKDTKFVETIRKTGGPEDQSKKSGSNIGIASVKPAAPAAPAKPAVTGSTNNDTAKSGSTATNDNSTFENYMGVDQPYGGSGSSGDTYRKVQPDF